MKEAILAMLDERANSLRLEKKIPDDYASLRTALFQLELEQEIEVLGAMLRDSSVSFAEQFKKRCLWRATDTEQTIPFSNTPESITNQLYWQIALYIYKPKTMEQMLAIILPNIKTHLTVSISDFIPMGLTYQERKKYLENGQPLLEKAATLNALNSPPSLNAFASYVVTGDMLFDISDISNFSLRIHAAMQQELSKKYPEMTAHIPTHNFSLKSLYSDIQILNNKGVTPRIAIEQLIDDLTLGGERMTGNEWAGTVSQRAVQRFYEYFNPLATEVKNSLRALKGEYTTFGLILDEEIKKGDCVETAASHLSSVLKNNMSNPILYAPPKMSPGDLKKLEKKYRNNPLDTQKDIPSTPLFPAQLTKKAVQSISLKFNEDLVYFLLNFPPQFYEVLWEHLVFTNRKKRMDGIALALKNGFFNPEQKQALFKAIIKTYNRIIQGEWLLIWATKTNDVLFFLEVLDTYPNNKKLSAIQSENGENHTCLFYAVENPKLFQIILAYYPQKQRLKAIRTLDKKGNTVLHATANNANGLIVLIELLSERERIAAIKTNNSNNDTVLYSAANYPETLDVLLSFFPVNQKLDAMKLLNKEGTTVLHAAAHNPESLKVLLTALPIGQRLAAVLTSDKFGRTVLQASAINPLSLKLILELLPENQRPEAINAENANGNPILHCAVNHPESLNTLLMLYPENQRLKVSQIVNKKKQTLFHLVKNPESLKILLSLYADNQRIDALKMADDSGYIALHDIAIYPEVLKTMFTLLPENQHQDAITVKNKFGNSLLFYAVQDPQSLQFALALYPEEQRMNAVQEIDIYKNSVLHYAKKLNSLEIILKLYPLDQRVNAIRMANLKGETVLDFANTLEAIVLIASLVPENQIVDALTTIDGQGKARLHITANSFQAFHIILDLLPENQRLKFLKTTGKKRTILEAMAEQKEVFSFSPSEGTKNSFVPDLINIYSTLTQQKKIRHGFFLKDNNPAANLIHDLDQYDTFSDIKKHLIDFVSKNLDNPLSTALLARLVPRNTPRMMLDSLKQRWTLDSPHSTAAPQA